MVIEELTLIKRQQESRAVLKKARTKRKRLPIRQSIISDIYRLLIQDVQGKNYKHARLKLAFCLLAVTRIGVNELLPLKVRQLETLIKSSWIAINF